MLVVSPWPLPGPATVQFSIPHSQLPDLPNSLILDFKTNCMELTAAATVQPWPFWRKIIFRFFFILLSLLMSPWTWLDSIPGMGYITKYYGTCMDWLVNTSNRLLFHVRPVLVPTDGSGDTSYGWAQVWLFLSMAVAGCIAWSVLDRRRPSYTHLNYWLCLFARYFVAMTALSYGILKVFAMQMYFPSLHQLATPLGDLLPMRFSWLFIGYSTPYQVFSGVMEVIAGLLLLYRRTSTMGALFATAVFMNVAALNLCYDIPVKIFSMQLVLFCLFLVANESNRILCFFILNKPAAACELYHFRYTKKWMRIIRLALKIVFIIIAVIMPFSNYWDYYKSDHKPPAPQPVKNGVYTVQVFARNYDSTALAPTDSLRWRDLVLENGTGSMQTSDTLFRHRYNRAYFSYGLDSTTHTLGFKKRYDDSLFVLQFRFEMPDSNTLRLWGKQKQDSLYIELKRTQRHFQLAEKQFHWLSEANR